MSETAPATNAAPAGSTNAAEIVAKVEAQTAAQTAAAVAQDDAALDAAWSKAAAEEGDLSLEDGRGRDSKGRFQKDDGPPGEGQAKEGGQEEASVKEEPAAVKAKKFSQAVREKARQNREQMLRRQQLEEENARLAQVARQRAEDEQLLRSDPVAFLKRQGKTSEEIAQILLNSASDGTPEGDLKALKQEIAELKRQQHERDAEDRRKLQEAQHAHSWKTFMENQGSNADDYPLLAATPEPFVKYAATEVAKAIRAAGERLEAYDDDDFAQGVELWLQKHRREAKAKEAADKGQGTVERTQKAPAPRTATPALNGRRHAPRADFKSLSLDQQDSALDDMWAKSRSEEDAVRRG